MSRTVLLLFSLSFALRNDLLCQNNNVLVLLFVALLSVQFIS